MARNRMIKPEFWEDTKVIELSPYARLFFISLWNFADDEGYLRNDHKWLKLKCLSGDDVEISDLIDELLDKELITIQNGIINVNNFLRHQVINRPTPSTLKEAFFEVVRAPGTSIETSRKTHGTLIETHETSTETTEIPGTLMETSMSTHGLPYGTHSQKKLKEVKRKEKEKKLKEKKKKSLPVDNVDNVDNFQSQPKRANLGGTPQTPVPLGGLKDLTANGQTEASKLKSEVVAVNAVKEAYQSEAPPLETSVEIVQDTSPNTFIQRVNYAKSLGVEESVALRLCNFAQTHEIPLCRVNYEVFAGSVSEQKVSENLEVLEKTYADKAISKTNRDFG